MENHFPILNLRHFPQLIFHIPMVVYLIFLVTSNKVLTHLLHTWTLFAAAVAFAFVVLALFLFLVSFHCSILSFQIVQYLLISIRRQLAS